MSHSKPFYFGLLGLTQVSSSPGFLVVDESTVNCTKQYVPA